MNKRGVSPLIATVLLIGFSIAMAAVVSTFVIKQTKEFDVEKIVGSDELCSEVSFQFVKDDPAVGYGCNLVPGGEGGCGAGDVRSLSNIKLKNKGSFSIWKLTINSVEVGSYPVGDGLEVIVEPSGDLKAINFDGKISFCSEKKVNVVPHIKDPEENIVECPSRAVTLIPSDMCEEGDGAVGIE